MDFIENIKNAAGKKAKKNMVGMQAGNVVVTYASIDALIDVVGFKPAAPLRESI